MPSPLSRTQVAAAQPLCHLIRQAVFTAELGLPAAVERDALDADSLHLLTLTCHDEAVATARLTPWPSGEWQLSRVAVVRGFRGLGYGKAIVHEAIALARQHGAALLWMQAHNDHIERWQRFGFLMQLPAGFTLPRPTPALPRTTLLYLDLRSPQ